MSDPIKSSGATIRMFSEPVKDGDQQYAVHAVGSETDSFEDFIRQSTDSVIVSFFRSACKELEDDLQLTDYHLKIQNNFDPHRFKPLPGWKVHVYYGQPDATGPLEVTKCMSCDMDCPLGLGVLGSGDLGPLSGDSLLREENGVRSWLDAKARPMFVFTPTEHKERLSDLTDEEVVHLLRTAVETLKHFNLNTFQSMILNHGNNRNHAHLHLKMRIPARQFYQASRSWDVKYQQQLSVLQQFASTLPESNKRHGGRHGGRHTKHHDKRHRP